MSQKKTNSFIFFNFRALWPCPDAPSKKIKKEKKRKKRKKNFLPILPTHSLKSNYYFPSLFFFPFSPPYFTLVPYLLPPPHTPPFRFSLSKNHNTQLPTNVLITLFYGLPNCILYNPQTIHHITKVLIFNIYGSMNYSYVSLIYTNYIY